MKHFLWVFLSVVMSCSLGFAQVHNLDFEAVEDGQPQGWTTVGGGSHKVALDDSVVKSGKYAAVIEYQGDPSGYKAWSYKIPATIDGKYYEAERIKLTGYVKTEGVTQGSAGLWMRLEPGLAMDFMNGRDLSGTTDWTRLEIHLLYPSAQAQEIRFGGMLRGNGKMWVDDLQLTLDGKPLKEIALSELPAARLDQEFKDGSGITIDKLSDIELENLELLGRIWGFLKYHHPTIAQGKVNWDFELFRILPDYLKQKETASRDALLLRWITDLGEVPKCTTCQDTDAEAIFKPDFKWMDTLSNALRERLKYIYKNRHQGLQYYLAKRPQGSPIFPNEERYDQMPHPDSGYRLLALYRYWNIIHYFFPYKHLTDKDWDVVLKEYIPVLLDAEDELKYEMAVVKLSAEINDSHAAFFGTDNVIQEWRGYNYAAVELRFVEDQAVVTDYYDNKFKEQTGLQIGDIITHIDGVAVNEVIRRKEPFYPASNRPSQLRNMASDLLRSQKKTIAVGFVRDGQMQTKDIPLYQYQEMDYKAFLDRGKDKTMFWAAKDIGYISLKHLRNADTQKIWDMFRQSKGLIIDIRNYPREFLAYTVGPWLVDTDTEFVKAALFNINNPGEFTLGTGATLEAGEKKYKGRVVVLVNELSQSRSEFATMVFQVGRNTTVIGSQTAGADGDISEIFLPGGLKTSISGIGIYYPDGKETQRIGVALDVEIKPTIEGIKAGRDEVLEKAVEYLKTSHN